MVEGWKTRIRELIANQGTNMRAVSLAAGKGETFVRDLLVRDRAPSVENFQALAAALGVTVPELLDETEGRVVRIVGRVGAGAEIYPEFEQVPPEGLAEVELGFDVPTGTVAFEVSGDSMFPRYDEGDVIVVWRDQRRRIDTFYGEEAAVRTADGRRFLKRIEKGPNEATVTLTSFNARPMEAVKIEWIGEIWLTIRKGQARRLDRKETRGRKARG